MILITGANSGLGKALCWEFASHKIPLLISGRNKKELEELAKSLPTEVEICVTDLNGDRKNLIQMIRQKVPEIIINNAGLGLYGEATMHSTQEELEVLEVNIKALTEITLEGAKALIDNGKKGTILNVSSAAAFFIYPSFAIYSASKAFVNHFSKSLDAELKSKGVRILCVCPGQIATPFRSKAAKRSLPLQDFLTMTPEKAAIAIHTQIIKQKSLNVIDGKYKLLLFISHFLPLKLVQWHLKRTISKRIRKF